MANETFFLLIFIFFSFAVAVSDIRTGEVPRLVFLAAFPIFFGFIFLQHEQFPLKIALAGTSLGLIVFLLVYFISRRRLGLADVWYSGLIGMVLGPWDWLLAITSACIAGIIIIIVSKRKRIPFIPFMAMGSIVMILIQSRPI